jgi:hypothetical protein
MNLQQLCSDFLDYQNSPQSLGQENEKIYNLCTFYLLSDNITEKQKKILEDYFNPKN